MQKASDTRSPKDNKILIVCGPTASGKTDLAVSLAKKFDGELVNADSRQMYQGMDVLSGKDIPPGEKPILHKDMSVKGATLSLCSYTISGIPIWLYDVAPVSTPLSISHFQAAATRVISDIHARGKLPIVVSGNGFYLSSLVREIPTISVPQNKDVRLSLEGKTVKELADVLASVDPDRWNAMNNSDKHNPRRLIRAIEVAEWKSGRGMEGDPVQRFDACWIGLRTAQSMLKERIASRVRARFEGGAVEEVKHTGEVASFLPANSTLGLSTLRAYIRNELNAEEAQRVWALEEIQYAKRQMVWFARNTDIQWFDREQPDFPMAVEKLVHEWYT